MNSEESPAVTEHPILWDDEKVARLWDYYARTASENFYFAQRFGRQILKATGLSQRRLLRVLDFGCGPGFIVDHLERLGTRWRYTGLDFSAASVRKVAEKASRHPWFEGAVHVTKLPSPLEDGAFDVVLLLEVVEHLDDDRLSAVLDEVRRLLRTGGTVVVTTPNEEDLSVCSKLCPECGAVFHEWQHVRSWTVARLARRFEQHGFRRQWARQTNFALHGARGRLIGLGRRLLLGESEAPHMIALFERR